MDDLTRKYLIKLSSYKEDNFTKEIIAPLFEAMGYQRVEFNGGAYERGRDLIATIKVPPSRKPKIVYIQSKKIGDQKRDSSRVLSDLGHQIRQACKIGYKTLDGTTLLPSEIYITCPEVATQRFLEEIQDQFISSVGIPIYIMDGQEIIENILIYDKDILKKLDSIEDIIRTEKYKHGNLDLLNALKSNRKEINVQEFYSDLSFFVGSLDSNALMHFDIHFVEKNIKLDAEKWKSAKVAQITINKDFGISIFTTTEEEIEINFEENSEKYNSLDNKRSKKELIDLTNRHKVLFAEISGEINDIISSNDAILVRERKNNSNNNSLSDISKNLRDFKSKINSNIDELSLLQLPYDINEKHKKYSENLNKRYSTINNMAKELSALYKDINNITKKIIPEPKYEVQLDYKRLNLEIDNLKNEYLSGVNKINDNELNFLEIKKFLRKTERTLNFISKLTDSEELQIFISEISISKNDDRVAISPIDVFSTNFDIAVYGGAGVGKTTTVEAYYNNLDEDKRKIKILIPLNRLASKITECESILQTVDKDGTPIIDANNLMYILILIYKGIEVNASTISEVSNIIESKKTTIILDGIDEIYNVIPKIFDGINKFKEKHPESQLIVTSRDCVSYLDKINFLGITLLPFTENQIKDFIHGWFIQKPTLASDLLQSISNRNLFDYLKTPLILTITCNLVEKGIDAPSTESEIYEARFSLLTGEYDKFKKIERQKNSSQLLKKISTRLAFIMHKRNIRAISKLNAKNELIGSFGKTFSSELIDSALNDLIDPCNVLLFDKFSDTVSFGHFRFQEHLASLELSTNRSYSMADLTRSDWWRGALCLFAQSNDIEFLIDDVYHKFQTLGSSEITLREMQKQTFPDRRKVIDEIINRTKKQDLMDEVYFDYHQEIDEYRYFDNF